MARQRRARFATLEERALVNGSPSESDGEEARSEDDADYALPEPRKHGILKRPSTGDEAPHAEASWLLSRLKAPKVQAKTVAKEWLTAHRSNGDAAVAALVTLTARASGVNAVLEASDVSNADGDDIREKVEACNSSCDDALLAPKKELRKLRDAFIAFWHEIVTQAEASGELFANADDEHNYDDEQDDDAVIGGMRIAHFAALLADFVEQLSQSRVRQLRHGGTVVALELITGLVIASKSLRKQASTASVAATAAAQPNKRRGKRHDVEQETVESELKLVDTLASQLFKSVFSERFRDTNAKTRSYAISSHGRWLSDAPERFLAQNTNANLKYLGWALNDREADVRQASLMALNRLYKEESNLSALSDFTTRFKVRIVQMLNDCSPDVVVRACETVKTLFQQQLAAEHDIKSVFNLLFDDSSNVRNAAADAVAQTLASIASDRSDESCLKWLLHTLRPHSGKEERIAVVTHSLQGHLELISQWDTLLRPLSDSTSWLSTVDEGTLATLVCKSARLTAADTNTRLSKKDLKLLEHRRQGLNHSIAEHVPAAIRRHSGSDGIIAKLAELVLYSDLDNLVHHPQDRAFEHLVEALTSALAEHDTEQSLAAIARSLRFCFNKARSAMRGTMESTIRAAHDKVASDVIEKLKRTMESDELKLPIDLDREDQRSELEHERRAPEVRYARASLERLYHLSAHGFRPQQLQSSVCELREQLLQVLNNFVSAHDLNERVVQLAASNAFLLVLWDFYELREKDASERSEQSIADMQKHADDIHFTLEMALSVENASPRTRRTFVRLAADFFVAFAPSVPRAGTSNLRLNPSTMLIETLWNAIETEVFTTYEGEHRAQGSRRKILALLSAVKPALCCRISNWTWLLGQALSCTQHKTCNTMDTAKLIMSNLRGESESRISDVFKSALSAAFERWRASHESASELHEHSSEDVLFQAFQDLGNFLSQSIPLQWQAAKEAGTDESAKEVQRRKGAQMAKAVFKAGLSYAMEDIETRVQFLRGVAPLVSKLDEEAAQELQDELSAHGQGLDEEDERWDAFFLLQSELARKAGAGHDLAKQPIERDGGEDGEGRLLQPRGRMQKQQKAKSRAPAPGAKRTRQQEQRSAEEEEPQVSGTKQRKISGAKDGEEIARERQVAAKGENKRKERHVTERKAPASGSPPDPVPMEPDIGDVPEGRGKTAENEARQRYKTQVLPKAHEAEETVLAPDEEMQDTEILRGREVHPASEAAEEHRRNDNGGRQREEVEEDEAEKGMQLEGNTEIVAAKKQWQQLHRETEGAEEDDDEQDEESSDDEVLSQQPVRKTLTHKSRSAV